jgi:nucleolar protein 58
MLLLFESPAGYALFKVLEPGKLGSPETIWDCFTTPEKAAGMIKLKAFTAFENTTEAVVAATSLVDGSIDKGLKSFLKKSVVKKDATEELAVADTKLGGLIKETLSIKCVANEGVNEMMRGVRYQMDNLLEKEGANFKAMQLGLSHSLSRYKLKFSADKVDIMIIQAIGLLDDLDKEINIYGMRVREWYGWHFPEMAKIVNDNLWFAKCVLRMGMRKNCKNCDFSDILGDETMEENLKKTAETSMGTEISDADLLNVSSLCEQVVSLSEYRLQLFEYLKNRMAAIAPNLTVMVGELVGARLVAHAGSILNLAKHPASTIQILGAEKALFRALKTKHETPKYGLIYHASLIGQVQPKNKGKISRVLAAKTALAIRVDALGDNVNGPTVAIDNRAKVEARVRQLESGNGKLDNSASGKPAAYDAAAARAAAPPKYSDSGEVSKKEKKRARDDDEGSDDADKKKQKKEKKEKKEKKDKKEKKEKKDKK